MNSRLQTGGLSFYFYSLTDLECGTRDPTFKNVDAYKTGRRGKNHLKAVRKSLKIISACLTEMFEIAADSTVAETL